MSIHRYQVIRHTDKTRWVVWDTGASQRDSYKRLCGKKVAGPFVFKQDADAAKTNLDRRL